jgi:hypothetical protein
MDLNPEVALHCHLCMKAWLKRAQKSLVKGCEPFVIWPNHDIGTMLLAHDPRHAGCWASAQLANSNPLIAEAIQARGDVAMIVELPFATLQSTFHCIHRPRNIPKRTADVRLDGTTRRVSAFSEVRVEELPNIRWLFLTPEDHR